MLHVKSTAAVGSRHKNVLKTIKYVDEIKSLDLGGGSNVKKRLGGTK